MTKSTNEILSNIEDVSAALNRLAASLQTNGLPMIASILNNRVQDLNDIINDIVDSQANQREYY